ncbi:MAG TPA: hypothetical protein VEU97_07585 [Ktedonobacteraceae bacterium]|nr:hypothetical protein [Ktedonobacteraceae bacterium]
MIKESGGASLGLLLAVPLFAYLSVPIAIALCALVMLLIGIVGLVRFGVSEQEASMVLDEQHDMVS